MYIHVISCLLLLALPPPSLSDFGGHDLFTSLAQLEVLWHNEREIVSQMEGMLEVNENITKALNK